LRICWRVGKWIDPYWFGRNSAKDDLGALVVSQQRFDPFPGVRTGGG
jgi:hypothetical protein